MNTPVLFLIFNRPDTSCRVFERIRAARPTQLFIAADGPRPQVASDVRDCSRTRTSIMEMVDWPCEVKTLFREENLGCKQAVSSAITWFFEQVEEGIILEDDCLPDPTFFPFCAELLERYRDDPGMMMISGNNFLPERSRHATDSSYLVSRCILIWGWATWRRAWQHYDISMQSWSTFRESGQLSTFLSHRLVRFWSKTFDFYHTGKGTSWDVQWVYACWEQSGCGILPRNNLVENIGETGVHMKPYDPCINIGSVAADLPIKHPQTLSPDPQTDKHLMNRVYRSPAATVWFILAFLGRSAVSSKRNLWKDLRATCRSLGQEIKHRYLS